MALSQYMRGSLENGWKIFMLKLYSFHIQVFHLPLHGTLYTEVTHHLMHATSFMCKVEKTSQKA